MKIKIELFGASRDLSDKEFLELDLKGNSSIKDLKNKIVKFRDDELHHKDIAYEEGATKKGLYSIMDKIIKTGSRIAIGISEKV